MAKLNWTRVSRQNQQRRQPVLNFDKRPKKSKLARLWTHAIQTETKFLRGIHWNKEISVVLDTDPAYCIWILENQPNSIVAKQIIRHFNR